MRFLAALLFAALAAPTGLAQSAPRPAPEASDSRADLVAALDRAIHNKAHGEYRVTLRGDRIQLQRQNEGACAVLIPVTEATRVEAVGTMILQFQAPGIRLEDCSNGGPREATGVLFLEERDRDAALDAARGLIRGWNEALPDGPTPPVRPAEPDRQPDAQTIRGTLT
ncbi:MAG TPA: hypothetical protein EYG39_13560, partial [Rhodothermales bacterium]|nr:hypothetical protein [Rhodothermales bacterium]